MAISYYKLLPRQVLQPLAYLIPVLELITAGALWLSPLRRAAWQLAGAQFLLFAGAVGSAVIRGLDVSCGCFGGDSNVSWLHVFGNLALAALCYAASGRDTQTSDSAAGRLLFLGLLSGSLACLHHAVRSERPLFTAPRNPGYEQLVSLSLEQMRSRSAEPGVLLVDARSQAAFSRESLPGALSLPLHTRIDEPTLARLKASPEVIVFCSSRQCRSSHELAVVLKRRGVLQVQLFPGGMEEWTEAGYPTEPGSTTSEVTP